MGFLFNTYSLSIPTLHALPEAPLVQYGTLLFFLRRPYMRSPTETIQQLNTFIKTQKVPGHRLCKSALFSEAESIKTAD